MSAKPRFTPAQLKALAWLSGEWQSGPKGVSAAIQSLSLQHRGIVQHRCGRYGPRGGWRYEYRLTDAGLAAKKEMES